MACGWELGKLGSGERVSLIMVTSDAYSLGYFGASSGL